MTLNTDTDEWKTMKQSEWINANSYVLVVTQKMFEGDAAANEKVDQRKKQWEEVKAAGETDDLLDDLGLDGV